MKGWEYTARPCGGSRGFAGALGAFAPLSGLHSKGTEQVAAGDKLSIRTRGVCVQQVILE